MRISKALLSLIAVGGLVVAVGCADEATPMSGVDNHKKSAPAASSAATETTTTTTTTTTETSAPASSAAASAPK